MSFTCSMIRYLNSHPILKRILIHAAFWLAWMSRTFYDIITLYSFKGAMTFSCTYIATQLPFVYLHLYVLVPFLLNRKKYISYVPLTILSLFAYSYFNYFVLLHVHGGWMPNMDKYIQSLNPNYDILEGLFAFIITYSLKYTWMAITNQNKVLELQKDNLQLELNALKAQINPHFLFNTLNNIYALALSKSGKTPEMILKLSDMMRYLLYECNASKVTLKKEIQFLFDFIDLEKIRHDQQVEINFSVTGNTDDLSIEPLLLIPFIENCFKHGVNSQIGKGYVDIVLGIENNKLALLATNTFAEKINDERKNTGIGLVNVKKRLSLLYPLKHKLTISSEKDTFTVSLEINMNPASS